MITKSYIANECNATLILPSLAQGTADWSQDNKTEHFLTGIRLHTMDGEAYQFLFFFLLRNLNIILLSLVIPVSGLKTNGAMMLAEELIPERHPWTIPYIKDSSVRPKEKGRYQFCAVHVHVKFNRVVAHGCRLTFNNWIIVEFAFSETEHSEKILKKKQETQVFFFFFFFSWGYLFCRSNLLRCNAA